MNWFTMKNMATRHNNNNSIDFNKIDILILVNRYRCIEQIRDDIIKKLCEGKMSQLWRTFHRIIDRYVLNPNQVQNWT